MASHHTKDKGDLGVLKAQIDLFEQGADKNGTHTSPIDKNEVDIYCVYCPDTDECYYLRPELSARVHH